MIKRILNFKSKTIAFSAALIAFSTGVSALLGLLRDRLLAGYFGAGESLDVYFAAFRIPDFIYGIVITGGIVAAFLPVFSESLEKNKEEGWKLANNTLNLIFLILLALCAVLFLFAPQVVRVITPGFSASQRETTTLLTRIMMISPILLGISSLFSGILQYFERFLVYSLAPIFYNLGIIFAIIFLVPMEGVGIIGLAYGVVLGSFAHLLTQVPLSISCGYSYKAVIDFSQKGLRRIFKLVIPRIIGHASAQINLVAITAIASTLAVGSIAIFNFADHLQAFPVRIIGVSFAVAAFPAFSRSVASKNKALFLKHFNTVVRQVFFLIIPLSVFVFLLRAQIVRLVLGTGEFGWVETRLTAASLGIFALGFFAFALIHILVRAFFALQDTRTPLYGSLLSMFVSVSLSLIFVYFLQVEGVLRSFAVSFLKLSSLARIEVIAFPMALVIAALLHFFLLFYLLRKKTGVLGGKELLKSFLSVFIASFVMGIAAFITIHLVDIFFYLETFIGRLYQTTLAFLVSFVVYILISKKINREELFSIWHSLSKQK